MKKNRGFTIVELLIYSGLLAILITILTRLFTATVDVQLSSEAASAVEEDSRYIYSRLAYDITRADSIVTLASPGESSNSLTITIGSVANTYSMIGNNLMLGTDQLNSSGTILSNLSFYRLGNVNGKDSIQIKFTITSTTQQVNGPDTKNIETTITQR
jgi:type II secretory pathway pseudopilin PulG